MNQDVKIIIEEGNLKGLKKLNFDDHSINRKDGNGNTLLHLAVIEKQLSIVKYLLKRNANINAVNLKNETPLDIIDADKWNPAINLKMNNEVYSILIKSGGKNYSSFNEPVTGFKHSKSLNVSTNKLSSPIENKSSNNLTLIFCFTVVLALCAVGYFHYFKENKNNLLKESAKPKSEVKKHFTTNDVFIAYSLANVHFRTKEFEQGLIEVNKILDNSDKTTDVLKLKLDLLYNLDRYPEAYYVAKELIEMEPDKALWHYSAGLMAYNAFPESTKAKEALPHHIKNDELDPSRDTKIWVAMLLVESGDSEKGFSLYETLLEKYPNNEKVLLNYKSSLWENQDFEHAEKVFRNLQEKNKRNASLNLYLAEVLDQRDKFDEAVNYYRISLQLNPRSNSRAEERIMAITGKQVENSLTVDKSGATENNNSNNLIKSAKKHEEQGDLLEALNLYEKAQGRGIEFKRIAKLLAETFEKMGAYGSAREFYNLASMQAKAIALMKNEDTISPKSLIKYKVDEIFKYSKEACVTIRVQKNKEDDVMGSGFFVGRHGYILTNEHVVENANKIEVKLYNKKLETAKMIATDFVKDIALIQIEKDHPHVLKLGDSKNINEGDQIVVIGTPLSEDYAQYVNSGIISKAFANFDKMGATQLFGHDALVDPGNSGSPVLNNRRRVIGIHTSYIANEDKITKNKQFAVKINEVIEMLEENNVSSY
jgi:S1-C subfamily serine protease